MPSSLSIFFLIVIVLLIPCRRGFPLLLISRVFPSFIIENWAFSIENSLPFGISSLSLLPWSAPQAHVVGFPWSILSLSLPPWSVSRGLSYRCRSGRGLRHRRTWSASRGRRLASVSCPARHFLVVAPAVVGSPWSSYRCRSCHGLRHRRTWSASRGLSSPHD